MEQKKPTSTKVDLVYTNFEYFLDRGVDINNRVIQLTEDIEEYHFSMFDAAMTTLEHINRKTITIKINSYGGDAHTALAIVGRMRETNCKLHTKGYGKIMSASTAILAAGHKRSMSSLAQFMHHEVSYQVDGRHSEIIHEVRETEKLNELWSELMEELTEIPKNYWLTNGVGKDFYLSPQDCLNLNIVDEVF